MGITAAEKGLVYRSGSGTGSSEITGADFIIDYTISPMPKFVIGGYANDGTEVKQNKVILTNGLVNGPMFGGLSHVTKTTDDVVGNTGVNNTSANTYASVQSKSAGVNQNLVEISGVFAPVIGDVYGGNATIWLEAGTANAGGDATAVNATAQAYAIASVTADSAEANASNNTVTLGQSSIQIGTLYGGYAALTAQAGEANGGNATANVSNSSYFYANANAYATVDIKNATIAASNNTVTSGKSTTLTGNLNGGYAVLTANAGDANASDASINISGASYGGNADADANAYVNASYSKVTANSNTVTLGQSTTLTGNLNGGYAMLSANGGIVNGGSATADATVSSFNDARAYAVADVDTSGTMIVASSNTIALGQSTTLTGNLNGGYAVLSMQGGIATGDDVTATSTISNNTASAAAAAMTTTRTIGAQVTASQNSVTVGQSTRLTGDLSGGRAIVTAKTGKAKAGDTKASEGSATSYADTSIINVTIGIASDNTVGIHERSTIDGNLYGGQVIFLAQTSEAEAGKANASGGLATASAESSIQISSVAVEANDNNISIDSGSTIGGNLYGGYVTLMAEVGEANAQDATADAEFTAIAPPTAYGGAGISLYNATITANDNSISIASGSTIDGSLYGGYATLTAVAGKATAGLANGNLDTADASINTQDTKVLANNNLIMFDGTLRNGSIYGGYTEFTITQGMIGAGDLSTSTNEVKLMDSKVEAINNTLMIGDNAVMNSLSGNLYGGYLKQTMTINDPSKVTGTLAYDVFTGNTLSWSAKAPATFARVSNFEFYQFTINPAYVNSATALITAGTIELGANASNVSTGATTPSKIVVVGIHAGNVLYAGDTFILIRATNSMTGAGIGGTYLAVAQQGISLFYDVETNVNTAGKLVTATILNCQTGLGGNCPTTGGNGSGNGGNAARVNPQLKALSESSLAGTMLVTRGADMIAYDAFSAINHHNNQSGWVPFIMMVGEHNRYSSGSHIISNDFLLTGGISYQNNHLTLGAFLEAGWGNYDTYNSFYAIGNVRGDGNSRYFGAGLLARYNFEGGFYTDASIRFGRNRNKFDTADIVNLVTGQNAKYSLKRSYLSA